MCASNYSPSADLSKFNFNDLFAHCDDLCTKRPVDVTHNLLSYLAWSARAGFDYKTCYEEFFQRVPIDHTSHYGFNNWESHLFSRRVKLLSSNNKAYEIAVKINPSAKDLEEFSKIDPCFSTLYPIKLYLHDHPDVATEYRGMLPFGGEVVRYYNTIVPADMMVKGSPSFKDHINLREISNRKAILLGMPSITINNIMYNFGKLIRKCENTDVSDDQD